MRVDQIAAVLAAHQVSVDHFRRRGGWAWWCSCHTDGERVYRDGDAARQDAGRHQAEQVAQALAGAVPAENEHAQLSDLRVALDAVRRSLRNDPTRALPLLGELELAVRDARALAAVRARVEHGWSWVQIGQELGISSQGARKAFGRLAELFQQRREANQRREPRSLIAERK